MITKPEQQSQPDLRDAQTFVDRFIAENPTLTTADSRRAYYAAAKAGYYHSAACLIEARVLAAAKQRVAEEKRARNEWLCDFQAAR